MKRIFKVALSAIIALSLVTTPMTAFADGSDIGTGGSITGNQLKSGFVVNSNYAYGVRISLYDKATNSHIKHYNILNHSPATFDPGGNPIECWSLGDLSKLEARRGVSPGGGLEHEVKSVPSIGSGPSAKQWAISNTQVFIKNLGISPEEWNTGKYILAVEPIQQIKLGDRHRTFIGTPTEIAKYCQTVLPDVLTIISGQKFSVSDTEKLVRSTLGNMTHYTLPSHYYLEQGGHLGLSSGKNGWYTFSSIISTGGGVGVIFTGSQMKCPHTGPWKGKTIDPNDPNDVPHINNYNGLPINHSLPPHGSEEARKLPQNACICIPLTPTNPEDKPPVIPADFLNEQFVSETKSAKSKGSYAGCSPDDGTIYKDVNGSRIIQHNETGSYSGNWSFLGDRKYTAKDSNLLFSNSYNGSWQPPEVINHYKTAFETDHQKDADGTGSAEFPSVKSKFEWTDRDGDTHTTTKTVSFPNKDYTAEQTVFETSKSKTYPEEAYRYPDKGATYIRMFVDTPKTIKMLPSYKMKYYDGVAGAPQDAWMLSSGVRSFTFTPFLEITQGHSSITPLSPWSRDYEDLKAPLKTTKAGNAYKLEATPYTTKIKLTYYVKDTFFENGNSVSIPLKTEYIDAVQYVAEQISDVHYFTNVPWSGDDIRLIWNNMNLPKPPAQILSKTLVGNISEKKQFAYSAPKVTVTRLDINGTKDTKTSTTVGGNTPVSEPLSSFPEVAELFVPDNGWYKEDYEGLIRIEIEQEVNVQPTNNQWFELNRNISDWLDKVAIQRSNPVPFLQEGGYSKLKTGNIYNGDNFVVGYASFVEPASFGTCQIPRFPVQNKYHEFMIRGSAFDQH